MIVNNDLSDFICVESGVNYYNCIYAYQHKVSGLSYIGQAKNYVVRDGQHLSSVKSDDSKYFDAVYNNPDDWYRVIIHQDLPTGVLDVIEAQLIQEYGTYQATRGYNKTKGNLITVKKSLVASKQLDLSGKPVQESRVWKLSNPLYSLYGTKGEYGKVKPHIDAIPVLDDCITDFYEPFAGAGNISRFLGVDGRLHDDLRLHLNDANLINYNALRAVMEDPEELIDCIKNLLPVLDNGDTYTANYEKYTPKYISSMNGFTADGVKISLDNPRFVKWSSDPRIIDLELIKDDRMRILDIVCDADHSVYDLEVIAASFFNDGNRKLMYQMVNGESNLSGLRKPFDLFSKRHIINGSSIIEYSEFLNHYNTVLSCLDYKDLSFMSSESSYIYSDSPYFSSNGKNVAQCSPGIVMDDYVGWLADLNRNGYRFTVSCNNNCVKTIYAKFGSVDNDATIAFMPLRTAAGQSGTIDDGVLWNQVR